MAELQQIGARIPLANLALTHTDKRQSLAGVVSRDYLEDSLDEGPSGQRSGPVHRLAVVLRTPAGAVDVDVVPAVAERLRFHVVVDAAVQHADSWGRPPNGDRGREGGGESGE